jgi:hypothetical protein
MGSVYDDFDIHFLFSLSLFVLNIFIAKFWKFLNISFGKFLPYSLSLTADWTLLICDRLWEDPAKLIFSDVNVYVFY